MDKNNQSGNRPNTAVEKATGVPASDHILNVIRAGLATVPFAGGFASLLSDYIPSAKQRRLVQFTDDLAAGLQRLEDRLDQDVILTDDFAFIFEKCFRGAAENYQQEKLDAFRGILLNSIIGTPAHEEEKEYFLTLVGTLSTLHIRILRFMANPIGYLRTHGLSSVDIRGGFSDFFPIAIPNIDLEVMKSAFHDLYQYGLINTNKTVFMTMTSGRGLELLGDRMTPFGRRFIEFCTDPT